MIRRSAPSLLAALMCAGLLVLTGCSSSGTGDSAVDVSTIPLQTGDLPSSWTAKAHDASDDAANDASGKKLAACVGAKDTSGDRTRHVYSKDYSMGNSMIDSDAEAYKSSSDIDSDITLFTNPKLQSCADNQLKAEVSKSLPAGSTVGEIQIKIAPGTNGGPSNEAATLTALVPITTQGQTITIYETTVYIRGDKTQVSIEFTGVGKPIDKSTITNAVAAVAKRAKG